MLYKWCIHPQYRDGVIMGNVVTFMDITDRKYTEQQELSRTHVLELLYKGAPLSAILETMVLGVEKLYPGMLCSILLLDKEGKHLLTGAAPSLPAFYNKAIHGIEIGMGVGSCGTAAYTGERVIVADISTHPYWKPFTEPALWASSVDRKSTRLNSSHSRRSRMPSSA